MTHGQILAGLMKMAAENAEKETGEKPAPSKVKEVLSIFGKGLLGVGAGGLAGVAAGHGVDALSKHFRGHPLTRDELVLAGGLAAGGANMAYNMWQAKQIEALHNALQSTSQRPSGEQVPLLKPVEPGQRRALRGAVRVESVSGGTCCAV